MGIMFMMLFCFRSFAYDSFFISQSFFNAAADQPPWHSGMSPHQYQFVVLNSAVKKCYGCGQGFVDKYRHHPYNIVVKHVDRRLIGRNEHGQWVYSPSYANTYYHPIRSHIAKKKPTFDGNVFLQPEMSVSLSEAQLAEALRSDLNVLCG